MEGRACHSVPNAATIGLRLKHLLVEGAYIPREYYVFDDRRMVYMPIYKVASTSIKTALLRPNAVKAEYPQYMDIHDEGTAGRHSLLHPRWWSYFKFAFVRDPFDRLISCYEDRVRRPVYLPIGRYYFDTGYNHSLIKRLFGASFSQDMSFTAFVALVTRIPDVVSDGHFKSQYAWLHRFGKCIPDYVGKLEALPESWAAISARCGGPASLEYRNRSDRRDVSSYYATTDSSMR